MAEEIWVKIQRKTFARWVDNIVSTQGMRCSDNLEEELRDGVILHTLLQTVSGTPLPKITPKPKVTIQKLENLSKIIKWIQNSGIKLVGTGGEDIFDCKTKYVLGLVWTLILYYQLDSTEDEEELGMSMRSALLEWCNNILQPQGITVKNFTENWKDGRAFCGLVNALQPNTIPLEECTSETALSNLSRSFDKAHELFKFPKMLDAEEIVQYQDELSIITYVSYFRAFLSQHAACAANTYAEGPGLTEALNNKLAHFTIFACDQNGNRVNRGGAFIRLNLKDRNKKECGKFTIKDHLDGTYSCTYETEKFGTKGNFELHVKVGNTPIKDSPFQPEIIPWEADPSKCLAFGPGVEYAKAGELTEFTIQAKDLKGDSLTKGGTSFVPSLKSANGAEVPVTVVDNNNGTYTCSYRTENASDLKLNIVAKTDAFGSGPIGGTPYSIKVGPGVASASTTKASGEGLHKATSGLTSTFTATSFDRFGNRVKEGGAALSGEVLTEGGLSTPLEVIDNGDGTYTLNYAVLKSGKHDIVVKIGEDNIVGAPFSVIVDPGSVSIENTTIDLLPRPIAGLSGATLQTFDEHSNLRLKGGDSITAECTPLSSISVTANDNGDGSYDIAFPPHARGKYRVGVEVNGVSAPKGPWEVEVKESQLAQDQRALIQKVMPQSAVVLNRLLAKTTQKERELLFGELSRLKK